MRVAFLPMTRLIGAADRPDDALTHREPPASARAMPSAIQRAGRRIRPSRVAVSGPTWSATSPIAMRKAAVDHHEVAAVRQTDRHALEHAVDGADQRAARLLFSTRSASASERYPRDQHRIDAGHRFDRARREDGTIQLSPEKRLISQRLQIDAEPRLPIGKRFIGLSAYCRWSRDSRRPTPQRRPRPPRPLPSVPLAAAIDACADRSPLS
jgi:hypothetical protein